MSSPRSPCGSGAKSYFALSEKQSTPVTESLSHFNLLGTKACKSKTDLSPVKSACPTSESPANSFVSFTPEHLADLIQSSSVLLIDMRSFTQYSCAHIHDAVNLCVPNTLLKRASFSVDKLAESLISEKDRSALKNWTNYATVVMYDGNSQTVMDNTPIMYLARKFLGKAPTTIGWLKGGFDAFRSTFPNLCQVNSTTQAKRPINKPMLSPTSFLAAPLTCPTPSGSMATPFFNNIRPHHDVTCELGEIVAIRTPAKTELANTELPPFLTDVAYSSEGKYKLSQAFKRIDKVEQKRLQSLLVAQAHHVSQSNPYSIAAGIERGSKNRYNNIWPYEHSRVKLEHANKPESDYINASFIGAKDTNSNRYIATQGPMPSTFPDFWEMVWEQNSRVIVMLTKEEEAGRIKCHRYWPNSTISPAVKYGDHIEVRLVSESQPLQDHTLTLRELEMTNVHTNEVRHLSQLHFIGWPDFGIPADPSGVLALRDIAYNIQQSHGAGPMIVHCSAGCGRTGAFCTIDTVLEMLASKERSMLTMKEDVIAEIVNQFRDQRLSMVQTLRQFVFCYEAVLWRLMGVPSCKQAPVASMPSELPAVNKTSGLMAASNTADYFAFSPSHNTTLSFNDPRRTSYFS
ncbi:hypothetical protein K493DRAFT_212497 [Basidiobolus meristosporus CBS 931.73]|uniref:protein-tyrosine-phosphatase n=1 Tax=Basidiobolus meristosporus CBS 931.73 TaxID=1314790 RepID=A0A1Y1YP33_9FUNG|nr:hypothetical protein K493DRAFT_212497 [Basidiobolus meristosporus CBS 931.73]|eukprot:ORX99526.1 hypothetical protein K493DRAFT_212497 [Basidiobolus meristosporus CBS 931.73]